MTDTKKILISGGLGFIGSNLVDRLIEQGHEVYVIDNLSTGSHDYLNPKAVFTLEDIAHYYRMREWFNENKGIDYIYHLAALPRIQPSIKNPQKCHKANVTGTIVMLQLAKEFGIKKFIYAASSSAYGNNVLPYNENMIPKPKAPYAIQKVMGEMYVNLFNELYDMPTLSLRFFNVYGKRQSCEGAYATVIGIFLRQLNENKALTIVGDGMQKRDFTYVDDIVDGLIAGMESDIRGEIINLGTGRTHSINKVASLIDNRKEKKFKYVPPRPAEAQETLADNNKAWELLGWSPKIQLEEGVELCRKELN